MNNPAFDKPSRRNLLASICIAPIAAAFPKPVGSSLNASTYDEVVPMTLAQSRHLVTWMLTQPASLLDKWGFPNPANLQIIREQLDFPEIIG